MSLSDLASIASVISGLAVLGSLVYLGLQTRQNAKHTKALIHQGRVEQATNVINLWTSDPEIFVRGQAADQTLDDFQAAHFNLMLREYFVIIEDLFFQHREGLVEENRHAGTIKRTRRLLQTPGVRAAWKMARDGFHPDFQEFMDGLAKEVGSAPARNDGANWKTIAAAELSEDARP